MDTVEEPQGMTILDQLLQNDPPAGWEDCSRRVAFRAVEVFRRLTHLDQIEMERTDDGIALAREEGSRVWELEFLRNGKLRVLIDCSVKLDLKAIDMLKAIGEAR